MPHYALVGLFYMIFMLNCVSYFIALYVLVALEMDYASSYPWAKKELIKETFVYTNHLKSRS